MDDEVPGVLAPTKLVISLLNFFSFLLAFRLSPLYKGPLYIIAMIIFAAGVILELSTST